jgi:AraC-like DNA-binding protein
LHTVSRKNQSLVVTKFIAKAFTDATVMDWLAIVTTDIQKTIGSTLLGSIEEASRAFLDVGQTLPAPRSPTEQLLLRGFLLELACRGGMMLHALMHAGDRRRWRCAFPQHTPLDAFFSERSADPRQAFARWAVEFFAALRRAHPLTKAAEVSMVLRRDYSKPVLVEELARMVNLTSSQLRRAFHQEFRTSLRDYYARARLAAALEHVSTDKIEAVALQVGFRRSSDFYRWFKKRTGFTPAAFRNLSDDVKRQIIDCERLALNVGTLSEQLRLDPASHTRKYGKNHAGPQSPGSGDSNHVVIT